MSFIYLFFGLPFLVLMLFLLAQWAANTIPPKNIIAQSVSAGDVRTDTPDLLPPVTFSSAEVIFRDKQGNFIIPDEEKHFVGRVQGKSMESYGMQEGAIFIAEKMADPVVRSGEIWVLNTPDVAGRNQGRKKLRKIERVETDGSFITSTFKNAEKTISHEHNAEDCVAKVRHYTVTSVSDRQLRPVE